MTFRLAMVIPTRNRASLAISAIGSLLVDRSQQLQVFVCDNSSKAEEVETLASFCRTFGDSRLVYIRPPHELTMPKNWDWAVREAMRLSDATHFGVHYDRKVTKRGELRRMLGVAQRFPDRVLTYSIDFISIENGVHHLWQAPYTGKVYEIRSDRVTHLIAQGRVWEMGHAFPILSNCVAPRFVLERIIQRFGDLCDSTGPDAAFCMRFCALFDEFLHLDLPVGVLYAIERSNGAGYLRGDGPSDFDDFMKMWGDRPWLHAAPLPGLNLGQNMLYHEYELARAEAGERFPEIDRDAYLRDLGHGLRFVSDPEIHARLSAYLKSHGWSGAPAIAPVPIPHVPEPQSIAARLAFRVESLLRRASLYEPIVIALARTGIHRPRSLHAFGFRSDEEALPLALKFSRTPDPAANHLHLMEPREIDV